MISMSRAEKYQWAYEIKSILEFIHGPGIKKQKHVCGISEDKSGITIGWDAIYQSAGEIKEVLQFIYGSGIKMQKHVYRCSEEASGISMGGALCKG